VLSFVRARKQGAKHNFSFAKDDADKRTSTLDIESWLPHEATVAALLSLEMAQNVENPRKRDQIASKESTAKLKLN